MDYTLNTALEAVDMLFAAAEAAEQLPGRAVRLTRAIARADAAEWGRRLRQGAGLVAAALVLAFVVAADLLTLVRQAAGLTYEAGFAVGTAVHRANDWLAPRWAALWVEPAAPEAAPARVLLALPAATAPVALLAPARLVLVKPQAVPAPVAPVDVTPLEQARQLVAAGVSVRQAAKRLGIARSTLQRRLQEVAA